METLAKQWILNGLLKSRSRLGPPPRSDDRRRRSSDVGEHLHAMLGSIQRSVHQRRGIQVVTRIRSAPALSIASTAFTSSLRMSDPRLPILLQDHFQQLDAQPSATNCRIAVARSSRFSSLYRSTFYTGTEASCGLDSTLGQVAESKRLALSCLIDGLRRRYFQA